VRVATDLQAGDSSPSEHAQLTGFSWLISSRYYCQTCSQTPHDWPPSTSSTASAAGAADLITTARQTGCTVSIVSSNSGRAFRAYLACQDLADDWRLRCVLQHHPHRVIWEEPTAASMCAQAMAALQETPRRCYRLLPWTVQVQGTQALPPQAEGC